MLTITDRTLLTFHSAALPCSVRHTLGCLPLAPLSTPSILHTRARNTIAQCFGRRGRQAIDTISSVSVTDSPKFPLSVSRTLPVDHRAMCTQNRIEVLANTLCTSASTTRTIRGELRQRGSQNCWRLLTGIAFFKRDGKHKSTGH